MGKIYSLRSDKKPNYLFEEEHKVLLFVDPNDCKTELTINDYTAFVLYDAGSIAAINLGTEKVQEVFLIARKFDDIAMLKGMVYAIGRSGILYLIDKDNTNTDGFKMVKIMKHTLYLPAQRKSRLFESNGELYLVRNCMVSLPRTKRKTMGLRVYRMNNEQNKWELLDSIGDDKILFVGVDCCFFARASDFIGCKGNCIVLHRTDSIRSNCESTSYLNHLDLDYYSCSFMDRDEGRLMLDLYHYEDCYSIPVEFEQGFGDVFWPPPKWLSTSDMECWRDEKFKVGGSLEEDIIAMVTSHETQGTSAKLWAN